MAYKVIVADSSPSIQKAVQIALSEAEFEVYPFADGHEVLKYLRQINPDVVFLRLSLPSLGGYEVGRFLRSQAQFKNTFLILFKGVFEPLDRERIAELDFDEIIQLPFASEKLSRLVLNFLERKDSPQTLPEEPIRGGFYEPKVGEELENKIKELVKKETLEVERQLEKKIKAQCLSEIKSWLRKELEEIRRDKKHKP